jgi:hypothetical protein
VPYVRAALALLGLVALGVGYDRDIHTGDAVNFFFYFTDLSNLFAAFVLLYGGVAALRGRAGVPDLVRGAAALYLVITGLVYWTLLANQITAETIKWQNDVVHGVMPVILLLDWLLLPPTSRLSRARTSRWLVFPLVYLAVSLVRGPIVQWWPYDFLDPREPGGYVHVTTWSVIVTVVFVLFTLLLTWAGNQLGGRRCTTSAPASASAAAAAAASAGSDGSPGSPSAERNLSSRSA